MATMTELPPGLLLILGALPVAFLRGMPRNIVALAIPLLSAAHLLSLPEGVPVTFSFFGVELSPVRIDGLSLVFGYIFHIAAALGVIYAFHVRGALELCSALIYAGAAIGAVFAGDLLTLFVYWELTAISSVFLILARGTKSAMRASVRYLVIQIGSGVILLAGIILLLHDTGSVAFGPMEPTSTATALILLSFGIKCAFPLLHNWLQDSYPQATEAGTVFLSAFTTKLAIYALARGFAGLDMLIWIGAIMAVFPIFYAAIENDLRRVLAYSLNTQLGFMVVGIGVGSELAMNGVAAHAFVHILYKSLLFMAMGAVLYRVGTAKASELGGLSSSMPWTTAFCIVGAATNAALPLFASFVSKSMIISATADEGHWIAWLVLMLASAGVILYPGIKVPFFAFFGRNSGKHCREAPWNMLLAMGVTAALCIAIGIWYQPLYAILPFSATYQPFTPSHLVGQIQLLFFATLAFATLMRIGFYPPEVRATNLDFDWFYRRLLVSVGRALSDRTVKLHGAAYADMQDRLGMLIAQIFRIHGPHGVLARTWPTGSMVLWAAVLLGGVLLIYFR